MARIPDLSAALTRPARPVQEKRLPGAESEGDGPAAVGTAAAPSFSQRLLDSQGRRAAAAKVETGEESGESSRAGGGTWLGWLVGVLGAQLGGKSPSEATMDSPAWPSPAGPPGDSAAQPAGDGPVLSPPSARDGEETGATPGGETAGQPVTEGFAAAVPPVAVAAEGAAEPPAPAASDSATANEEPSPPPLDAPTYAAPRLEIAAQQAAPLVRQAASLEGGESPAAALHPVAMPAAATPSLIALGTGPGGVPTAGPDPARVLEQVLDQLLVREAEPGGHERLTLKLEPPELGRVEVRLEVIGGRLEVTLSAETHEAESALRSRSHELVQGLAARGGRWTDVQVRLERQEGQGRQEQRQETRQEGRGGEERPDPRSGQDRRRRGQ